MDFRGERRGRYSCANVVSKRMGELPRPVLDRSLDAEEIAQLCKPVAEVFAKHSCYDAMGLSTQIVVVEVHSPLTVAFIAAQETKVAQCVLWDAQAKRFFGVLPTTEYIKILLYCEDHPSEKEAVTAMPIAGWLSMTEGKSSRPPLGGVVAAAPNEMLQECFAKMIRHKVRRSLLVSDKDVGDAASLVGVLTQETILQHLVGTLFSLDAGDTATLGAEADSGNAAANQGAPLPQRVKNIVLGVSPAAGSDMDKGTNVAVGPYRDIMDVPLSQLPGLGRHRSTLHKVTMRTPVKDALRHLLNENLHSIAVVDDTDIVIDVVSRTDVMRMETNGLYDINISVAEAIAFHVGGNIFVIHETDTIRDIVVHFAQNKVRELYIVDPKTDKLQGQLSMSELLKFLFRGAISDSTTT